MSRRLRAWCKLGLHVLLVAPLLWLVFLLVTNNLGADPAEKVVRNLGFNGAIILWLSLAMTPLRKLAGQAVWIAFRRLLGLWSFFYLTLHLLAFLVFWAGLNLTIIWEEVTERPYIYVGLSAWLLLVPLALTSTQRARRKLGRHWARLHKLVYGVAILAMIHIIWISKLDYLQSVLFGIALAMLFAARLDFRRGSVVAPAAK